MNQSSWADSNFYFITDSFQYTICGEVELQEEIDSEILQKAVDTAFRRYPYFSIRLLLRNGEFVLIPNLMPHKVVVGDTPVILGSEEVNYHLVVVSCSGNRIFFHVSHCITDGIGRAPLTKTVLYYYLTEKYRIDLDPEGIYLADGHVYSDEFGEPLALREIMKAQPTYYQPIGDACKISDHYTIQNHARRKFRFCVEENDFMRLCKSYHSTPNILTSILLSQVLWEAFPAIEKDLVVNLCLNMRPALHNEHSHLMLLANIPLHFPSDRKQESLEDLSGMIRQQIDSQRQEENVRYLCRKNIEEFERIQKIRNVETRQKVVSACVHGREGFLSPTYTVSYVGRNNLKSLSPYVRAMYTEVDSIPDDGAMLEITTADGKFFFSYLQDFSDDGFVRAFMERIEANGVSVHFMEEGPLLTPRIQLPQNVEL